MILDELGFCVFQKSSENMAATSAIPAFDRHGNLPIGDLFKPGASRLSLLDVRLDEIKDRFVSGFPHSKTRQAIWDGWMLHRQAIEKFGLNYATLVDGSFVTSKQDPKDVDLCLLIEGADINALEASDRSSFVEFGKLVDTNHTLPLYKCDTYLLPLYSIANPRFPLTPRGFTYWARVFGTDRKNQPKNFLLVTQRGVL
jgi:hypothetical protein